MNRFARVLATLLLAVPRAACHARAGRRRARRRASRSIGTQLRDEAVRVLADYLKVNTANPPGNEIEGALFLKAILEREGFEVQILDTAASSLGPRRPEPLRAAARAMARRKRSRWCITLTSSRRTRATGASTRTPARSRTASSTGAARWT